MAKKKAGKKKAKAQRKSSKVVADIDDVQTRLLKILNEPDSTKKVLKLLLSLDESQRVKLAPTCWKHFRQLSKDRWGADSIPSKFSAAVLAAFATASISNIRKIGSWELPDCDVILKVLRERQPDWIPELAEHYLKDSHYWISWPTVRELVRGGLCPKPDNPRYYSGMITGLIGRFSRGDHKAIDQLRKDPALLKDEVWKLFEFEGDGENTLANCDRFESAGWSDGLVQLSQEGRLSRSKLLDSALGALELGFNHYRAKWFFGFFDQMEPTSKELRKRAVRIQELIASPTPNVAQWAFDTQRRLLAEGLVKDVESVIESSAPLLGGRHKKTALQVLKLFGELANQHPQLARPACVTAAEALSHEKADVQKAALALIKQHGSASDSDIRDAVEKFAEVASAAVRKQVKSWSKETPRKQPTSKKKSAATGTSGGSAKQLAKKVARHDKSLTALFGLPSLVEQMENASGDMSVPAATFIGTEFPRLASVKRLEPIATFDELIESLGRVIEDDSLVDETERAIGGLVRLQSDRPDDFEKRIAPLFKRARKLLETKVSPFSGQSSVGDVCALICVWQSGRKATTKIAKDEHGHPKLTVKGVLDEPIKTWFMKGSPLRFLSQRVLEICGLLHAKNEQPLLSAPTHSGGWIDPAVLVQRLNQLTSEPPQTDVILAMLRLAPEGREAAVKKLKPKCKGEWLSALQYVMGKPRVRIGSTAALWAAAARCRFPYEDDPRVIKAFPKLGPGAGKAARFEATFHQEKTNYGPRRRFNLAATEPLPKKVPVDHPTQMIYLNSDDDTTLSFWDIGTTAGSIQWIASMWPSDRDTFFAGGALCLGVNLDWWEAAWHNRCFLEPLLDPDTPLRAPGELLLLCGLAAKEPGEHGLATDAALQAITDGRLGTDNFGRMLTTGLTSGHFNLTRLAKRLHDVAGHSDLHAFVVFRATEAAVSEVSTKDLPRGLADILELLHELGTQLSLGVESPKAVEFLRHLQGSNKAAKLAKTVLALRSSFVRTPVLQQAIESRLHRLQQWSERK